MSAQDGVVPSTVSVVDLGPVGDGLTPDDRVLQAAVDSAGPGGTVVFGARAYAVAAALRPLSGQTWSMTGARLVRAAGSVHRLVQANTVRDWRVVGGTFDGNARNAPARCTALVSVESGSTGVEVSGATFVDTITTNGLDPLADSGIRFVDSSRCRLDDSRGSRLGYLAVCGMDAGSRGVSEDCTLSRLTADTIAANVVFVSGSLASTPGPGEVRRHVVRDVVATDFWDSAVEIGQGAVDCSVSGVRADGAGNGQNVVIVRDNRGTRVHDVRGVRMRSDVGAVLRVLPLYDVVRDLQAGGLHSDDGTPTLRVG